MSCLEIVANWAQILTPVVGIWFWITVKCEQRTKRLKLEEYLKAEKKDNSNYYQHTLVHLMARLKLTEEEILKASFASDVIECPVKQDQETGLASQILFEYAETPAR